MGCIGLSLILHDPASSPFKPVAARLSAR